MHLLLALLVSHFPFEKERERRADKHHQASDEHRLEIGHDADAEHVGGDGEVEPEQEAAPEVVTDVEARLSAGSDERDDRAAGAVEDDEGRGGLQESHGGADEEPEEGLGLDDGLTSRVEPQDGCGA